MSMLRTYLNRTVTTKSIKIFMDPVSLSDLSVRKVRLLMCQFIREADPQSFSCCHDLRKMASSLAFLHSVSVEEICNVTGWASIWVFRKHNFQSAVHSGASCVVMGKELGLD